jgi:transporter family-2 protein
MKLIGPLLAAFLAGMLLPMQPAINAELRLHTKDAFLTSVVSFSVGLAALALVALAARSELPQLSDLAQAPWWAWLGGTIGALFVTVSLVVAPRLGAVLLVGAVVAGQLLSSALIDQRGWLGLPVRPVSGLRLAGLVVVLVGVVLVQLGTSERS